MEDRLEVASESFIAGVPAPRLPAGRLHNEISYLKRLIADPLRNDAAMDRDANSVDRDDHVAKVALHEAVTALGGFENECYFRRCWPESGGQLFPTPPQ